MKKACGSMLVLASDFLPCEDMVLLLLEGQRIQGTILEGEKNC
jgi:hypothetical protein